MLLPVDPSTITSTQVNHLPILSEFAQKMRIEEIINELVPSKMEVEPGKIVLGLVIDTLSGRSPLYHLEHAFKGTDQELLFGQTLADGYFNDDNVGRVLKLIYEAGTQKIFSELSVAVVNAYHLPTGLVNFDTTSISLYGQYLNSQHDNSPFEITFGYSKDKRPDLKQFILSLLCVGGNIPIFGKIDSGNASDKTLNNNLLSDLSHHMHQYGVDEGAFIYVADSAVVTQANLELMNANHQFITRLPATYNECERVIIEAVEAEQWLDIGQISRDKPTLNRPAACYRTFNTQVTLYGQQYRAVVVHSSAHDKRRHKRLQREVDRSLSSLKAHKKQLEKCSFACKKDAQDAADKERKKTTKFHQLNITVIEKHRYAKGRPKQETPRIPIETRYLLSISILEDEDALTKQRKVAGCFVLLSNLSEQSNPEHTSEMIIRTYKDQNAIEKNFGFLKDDQIVNALFLKLPEHIEALGLILLISLMLWRLMEYTMRTNLEKNGTTVPGWNDKPTNRPTAYMLTWKFKGLVVIKVAGVRHVSGGLSKTQLAFLTALNLSSGCYINSIDSS